MKLVSLLGATSTGKTSLSLTIAKHLTSKNISCVIVNCDSRQIYQKLNLGTGKIFGTHKPYSDFTAYFYDTIPHFLIDYVDPTIRYNLASYINDWVSLFENQLKDYNGYVILVGGTGLWAKAILEEYELGIINPNHQERISTIRSQLESKKLAELQSLLPNNKPLNSSDYHNPRRLINAILNGITSENQWTTPIHYPKFDQHYSFCISISDDQLHYNIQHRLEERISQGLIEEVKELMFLGDRLLELGLEYRIIYQSLVSSSSSTRAIFDQLLRENFLYAKRQKTWFNKQQYHHISPTDETLVIDTILQNTTVFK